MQAKLFYETQSDRAVPLYLMSQSQWEESRDLFTPAERNCFALEQRSRFAKVRVLSGFLKHWPASMTTGVEVRNPFFLHHLGSILHQC